MRDSSRDRYTTVVTGEDESRGKRLEVMDDYIRFRDRFGAVGASTEVFGEAPDVVREAERMLWREKARSFLSCRGGF